APECPFAGSIAADIHHCSPPPPRDFGGRGQTAAPRSAHIPAHGAATIVNKTKSRRNRQRCFPGVQIVQVARENSARIHARAADKKPPFGRAVQRADRNWKAATCPNR